MRLLVSWVSSVIRQRGLLANTVSGVLSPMVYRRLSQKTGCSHYTPIDTQLPHPYSRDQQWGFNTFVSISSLMRDEGIGVFFDERRRHRSHHKTPLRLMSLFLSSFFLSFSFFSSFQSISYFFYFFIFIHSILHISSFFFNFSNQIFLFPLFFLFVHSSFQLNFNSSFYLISHLPSHLLNCFWR